MRVTVKLSTDAAEVAFTPFVVESVPCRVVSWEYDSHFFTLA